MSAADPLPKLNFSPAVKQAVGPGASPQLKQQAARGELKLSAQDFLAALLVLCSGSDAQLKTEAVRTLRRLSAEKLGKLSQNPDFHPRLLDFLVRGRISDPVLLPLLLKNPNLAAATVAHLARQNSVEILKVVIASHWSDNAEILALLQKNPAASGLLEPPEETVEEEFEELETVEEEVEEVEEANLSKYQLALEMGVSEKIKTALTGDKEWRGLLYKDANKLVNSAVLNNPRISDGEVVAIAKNRAASDEHIRLISLNRKWIKIPEVQKALVVHPRTPLPKALRYMNILTVKELKGLAKSKTVSQVIANNARRMLVAKEQKK
ncbi:MAG: hypothetical protein C0624_13925 [Desulfuromonas sp.]|nr:MAG: hypothetical protein C0624_13925 [Desulfuromonas sp.]